MQTLTKSAHSNFLLKILYLRRKQTSFEDLFIDYAKGLGSDSISKEDVQSIMDELVKKGLVRFHNGLYYLSSSRMERIDKARESSIQRKQSVVSSYFQQVYSTPEQIISWLDDILVFFFDSYASEWITDLYYNKNYIYNSKDGLLKAVQLRTQNSDHIDKRDRLLLPDRFLTMVLAPNDPNVNQLLWEFGTTAFSAKLITAAHGANPVTLDTFRDSICLLDTNILMNIGLEESNYYKTLSSLEKVYERLSIKVKILPITRDEYLYTIQNIKSEIIRLVSKGYSDEVLKKTGDQYIQTAIERKCETEEDYDRFFEDLIHVPELFHERLAIEIEDNQNVIDSVAQNQADQGKVDLLGALHLSVHNDRKKPIHSLVHDVGLIAGAEELRKTKKAFILSQDSTISAYSRQRPIEKGLALSIKMETLINILALDSGGAEIDPQNYIPLFANMIRQGLMPDEKTFQIQDLARMSDMEHEITHLNDNDIVKLATSIANLRMNGESDEVIGLSFRRELQDVKRGVIDQLEDTKRDMEIERVEKERYRDRSGKGEKGLEKEIYNRVKRQFNTNLVRRVVGLFCGVVLIPGVLFLYYFVSTKRLFDDLWKDLVLSAVAEGLFLLLTFFITKPKQIIQDYKNRAWIIDSLVKSDLQKYYTD